MSTKFINLTDKERELIITQLKLTGNTLISTNRTKKALLKKLEKADKRITTQSAKAKGRGLQMWVCNKISALINIPFDNQDDQCLIHCREMGQSGTDVILRRKAIKLFPYSIECKNSESFNLYSTISQVEANQAEGTNWLIVHKRKTIKKPIVIMTWEAFEKIFRKTLKS